MTEERGHIVSGRAEKYKERNTPEERSDGGESEESEKPPNRWCLGGGCGGFAPPIGDLSPGPARFDFRARFAEQMRAIIGQLRVKKQR